MMKAKRMSRRSVVIINVSGRGDKDVNTIIEKMGDLSKKKASR